MASNGYYNEIMSDRKLFDEFVYTPLSEALKILEERQKDPVLMAKIEELLKGDIPEVLRDKKCAVFNRHVSTPNFDTQQFIGIAKENNLKIVLCEYLNDKFTSNNIFKHSLGRIFINKGVCKNDSYIIEKINIVDNVKYDGKKLKEVITFWGEPLVDFHRKLFKHYGIVEELSFYDISDWYKRNGDNASCYYSKLLLLFVAHGILFENFLFLKDSEGDFTKNIVLPAIEEVKNLTGFKPLIVPIPPMDMENEEYWISHPEMIKNHILINKKL